MSRLSWNAAGFNVYHLGIDRGVFYIGDVGLPWTGLASVTESPAISGSAQGFFMDGQKILNIPPGEDFGGTIECYSTPLEFAPCAGRLPIGAGLFAADQPRSEFGFSYRTIIGNDLVGAQYGYRIHVVYNAMTWGSDFTHNTQNESPAPSLHSWQFLTTPKLIPGRRPSAHVIFDTRYLDSDVISDVEDVLYGTVSTLPRLPTVEEVSTFLGFS